MLSFLKSETSEASYFNEADIMKFLHQFHKLEKCHKVKNENLIEILSDYCEYEKHNHVKTQKDFMKKN